MATEGPPSRLPLCALSLVTHSATRCCGDGEVSEVEPLVVARASDLGPFPTPVSSSSPLLEFCWLRGEAGHGVGGQGGVQGSLRTPQPTPPQPGWRPSSPAFSGL